MLDISYVVNLEKIRNLKSRYFRFLDKKDWQNLSSIFCQDAIFDARNALDNVLVIGGPSRDSKDWIVQGREEIINFISSRAATSSTVHHGHGHEIEIISGEQATGIIAMQDHNRYYDDYGNITAEMIGYGHYEEEYHYEDQDWRIFKSRLTRLRVDLKYLS